MHRSILTGIILTYFFLFATAQLFAQDSSPLHYIKVHFLYGSKPKKEHKDTEKPWFGGLHGGHASIETGREVIGFGPAGGFHIFARRKNFKSGFITEDLQRWERDSAGAQYVSVIIPLTPVQYEKLGTIHSSYLEKPPYDYAFFGMRCAAATYDILSQVGIIKPKGKFFKAARYFYPKLLRKKMLKLAKKRGYEVVSHPGKPTRKWEKD
jgi:hypothetical protein